MSLVRSSAAIWLGLAGLALIGWRQGLAFAVSSGGGGKLESILFDAADNPPWLITGVAAALLVSRLGDLRRSLRAPGSPLRASAWLAPGLALLAWARFVDAPDLALLGTLAMALGAAYAAFGGAFARLIAVPLGLLVFALPEPGVLVNQVVYPLQLLTADYTSALLSILGVTALQAADVIRTPSHTFLVIEGCSGLGSMEVLTLLALAWVWQARASWRRGLALVLAAPLIAFALNGLRVLVLVLFPDWEFWAGHTTQGVVSFAVGSLLIALLDRWLERWERQPVAPTARTAGWPRRPPLALVGWLAAAALVSIAVPLHPTPAVEAPPLLPPTPDGWTARDVKRDQLFLGSVEADRLEQKTFELSAGSAERERWGKESVSVVLAQSHRLRRDLSLQSRKLEIPGRGWRAVERTTEELPGGFRAIRVTAVATDRRAVSQILSLGLESPLSEGIRAFLALDRSPFRREDPALVLRITTEIARGEQGLRLAERRLSEIFRFLRPLLESEIRDALRKTS